MATSERRTFYVLAEDRNQYNFVRGWLTARFGRRKTQIFRAQEARFNSTRGSKEQAVRELLPAEIRKRRERSYHSNEWLVVAIDGDGHSPEQRVRQLVQHIPSGSSQ